MEQVSAEIKELGRRIDQKLEDISNKRKSGVTVNDPGKYLSSAFEILVLTCFHLWLLPRSKTPIKR